MKTKLTLALVALTLLAVPAGAQILPNANPQVLTPIEDQLYRAEKSVRLAIAILRPYLSSDEIARLEGEARGYHLALTMVRAELYKFLPVAQPSDGSPVTSAVQPSQEKN